VLNVEEVLRGPVRELDAGDCYRMLDGFGLKYGEAHRALRSVKVGKDAQGRRCVVTRLELPEEVAETADSYVLHPSLMDGALQGILGLWVPDAGTAVSPERAVSVPYAVDRVSVLGRCARESYAVIRGLDGMPAGLQKVDVEVYSAEGVLKVRLEGVSTRELKGVDRQVEISPARSAARAESAGGRAGKAAERGSALLDEQLERRTREYLKKVVAGALKVGREQLEEDVPLEKYGLDSILVLRVTQELESGFGSLSKTLFFEYPSVRELAGYFLETHRDELLEMLHLQQRVGAQARVKTSGVSRDVAGDMTRDAQSEARDAAGTPPASAAAVRSGFVPDRERAITLAPTWESVRPELTALLGETGDSTLFIGRNARQREALRGEYPYVKCHEGSGEESVVDLIALLQGMRRLDHVVWVAPPSEYRAPDQEALITEQQEGVLACFRLIKALLQLGYASRNLQITVVTQNSQAVHRHDRIDPTHASVHGLVGSLAKEHTKWRVRLVDADANDRWPWSQMLRLPTDAAGDCWAYRRGEWYRQRLLPCDLPPATEPAYREGGVYVVIGGAGGIGRVFSERLIADHHAHVIWLGRREEDEDIRACRARLAQLGPEPQYIRTDATDRAQLERACEQVRQRYGQIHGVVHSAIVLLDKSLEKMDEERFRQALAAKVDVSVRLAQVFTREPLDFVLFFSSLQSCAKMPGQSNYAAGCTFKDAHAHELARAWKCPVRVMNWGYWGSVGIVASEGHRQRMAQTGTGSIEPHEGMRALAGLLAGPFEQLGFIKVTGTDAPWGLASSGTRVSVSSEYLPSLVERLRQPEPSLAPQA
jgi:NAD(P)-dependent dehydrogenase (short-subunit alcohol dehydrogenase family)/acyl carrier protein